MLNELGFLAAERGDPEAARTLHLRAYDAGQDIGSSTRELTFALVAAAAAVAQAGAAHDAEGTAMTPAAARTLAGRPR